MSDLTIPTGAVARLRQATGAAHVHLEERLERSVFAMDVVPYRKLVAAFLGFYDPVERRLFERGAFDAEDYTFHEKSAWLRADLAALGLSRNEIADLPRCAKLPQIGSPAAAFGCKYVLEGATLGGRVILRRLSEEVASPDARRFFSSYGADVPIRWRAFLRAVEQFAAREGGVPEMAVAAVQTFQCLGVWLEDCGFVDE